MTARLELNEDFSPQSKDVAQDINPLSLYSDLRDIMQAKKQSEPPTECLPKITLSQPDMNDKPTLTTGLRVLDESSTGIKPHDESPARKSDPNAEEVFAERERVAETLRKYMDQMDLPGVDSKIKDGVLSKEELMTFLFISDKSKNLSDRERKDLMTAMSQFGWIANADADPKLPFQMSTISNGDINRWLKTMPWQLDPQCRNVGSTDVAATKIRPM